MESFLSSTPKTFLLLLLTSIFQIHAYEFTMTEFGRLISWPELDKKIYLYVDLDSRQNTLEGVSNSEIRSIIQSSVDEWNSLGVFDIEIIEENDPLLTKRKTVLRFVQDPTYFGPGVLGITKISYDQSGGGIYFAEILINDTGLLGTNFSTSKSANIISSVYFGDVVTHELGHLLGLNHTEVVGSTMVYALSSGQHTLHEEDRQAIKDLYYRKGHRSQTYNTSLLVRYFGLNELPIFGAHAMLYSPVSNSIVASRISDDQGSVDFNDLSTSNSYYLLSLPLKASQRISSRYRSVLNDFCNDRPYVISAYAPCGGRDRYRPYLLNFSNQSNISLSPLRVSCESPLHPGYVSSKIKGSYFDMTRELEIEDEVYGSMFGSFTQQQLDSAFNEGEDIRDNLALDLSEVIVSGMISPKLRINFFIDGFFSPNALSVSYKKMTDSTYQSMTYSLDPITGAPIINLSLTLDLSFVQAENIFDLQIRPEQLSIFLKNKLYGDSITFSSDHSVYFMNYLIYDDARAIGTQIYDARVLKNNDQCLAGLVESASQNFLDPDILNTNASNASVSENKAYKGCSIGGSNIKSLHEDHHPHSLIFFMSLLLCLGFGYSLARILE